MAFDFEQLAHLPFMALFSSREFPSVGAKQLAQLCFMALFSSEEFTLYLLHEGVCHACFRLMSYVHAGVGNSRPL